jgi:hypothetical protein
MRVCFLLLCLSLGLLLGWLIRPGIPTPPHHARVAAASAKIPPRRAENSNQSITARMEDRLAGIPGGEVSMAGREADDIYRAARLALALRDWPADELSELTDALLESDASTAEKAAALRMVAAQWVKIDPLQALLEIQRRTGTEKHRLLLSVHGAMHVAWAKQDREGWRAWQSALLNRWGGDDTPSPPPLAVVRTDPEFCLDARLANDKHVCAPGRQVQVLDLPEDVPWDEIKGEGPGSGMSMIATIPQIRDALLLWMESDRAAAVAWTAREVARPGLHPALAFFMVDQINNQGAHAAAAEMSAHLHPLAAEAALARILPRWQAEDKAAADAWIAGRPQP